MHLINEYELVVGSVLWNSIIIVFGAKDRRGYLQNCERERVIIDFLRDVEIIFPKL
jgi:hypothetical protein